MVPVERAPSLHGCPVNGKVHLAHEGGHPSSHRVSCTQHHTGLGTHDPENKKGCGTRRPWSPLKGMKKMGVGLGMKQKELTSALEGVGRPDLEATSYPSRIG